MQDYTTKIVQKIQLCPDMIEFHLEKPVGFSYIAGQFIQIDIPQETGVLRRSYSIASTPKDETIILCIKTVPGGRATTYLSQTNIGDTLQIRGPAGHFVCTEDATAHFFIATGAGIAPIMGMLRDELENKHIKKDINLLFGLRFEEDIVWMDKLTELAGAFENFHYRITLSKPGNGWTGLTGRVTEHLKEHPVDHDFYLCGSMDMVKDVRALLLTGGVSPKKVRLEIF